VRESEDAQRIVYRNGEPWLALGPGHWTFERRDSRHGGWRITGSYTVPAGSEFYVRFLADGDCPECYAGIQSGDGHNEGCSQRGDFGGFATPEAQQDAMCPDNAEETRQLIEVERDLHVARSERDEARYELAEARADAALGRVLAERGLNEVLDERDVARAERDAALSGIDAAKFLASRETESFVAARAELAEARAGLADANAHIANAAEAYSAAIRERNIAQNAEAVANAARAYVAARCSHGEGAMARDSDAWDALRAAVEGQ